MRRLPPTLRGRLSSHRLAAILALPYARRRRHLQILRYIAASTVATLSSR